MAGAYSCLVRRYRHKTAIGTAFFVLSHPGRDIRNPAEAGLIGCSLESPTLRRSAVLFDLSMVVFWSVTQER